jgi:outer membrane receptor protein involved in Fe transport
MKKGYEEVKLNPETSNTYEIGAKKEFGMRGYANLSIYYMNIKDTITRYTDSSTGDRYYDNGGETTHKGIEIGSYTKINDEIGLKIAYSYSRHNYVNDPKFADNEISQAPNNLANLRVFYTPEYLKKLKVMFEYQYIGSYWKDDAHKDGRYKGYKIGNIKAEYKYSKKLKFFTKITNITNERYANEASYAYGKEDYTPGSPRSAYIGFDYKW